MMRLNAKQDDGFTIVELMVTMSLLLIALTMFGVTLWTVQRASQRQLDLSQANDEARMALQAIDRQVRSGYVASIQTSDFPGADAVARIYTEARVSAVDEQPRCVAWVLYGAPGATSQTLYERSWLASDPVPTFVPAALNGWRAAVTGIVNGANGGSGQTFVVDATAFVIDSSLTPPTPVPIGQRLSVTFWLRAGDQPPIKITSSVSSRNVNRAVGDAGGGSIYEACV